MTIAYESAERKHTLQLLILQLMACLMAYSEETLV